MHRWAVWEAAGTIVLFFPFLLFVYTCLMRLPVSVTGPVCLPLLECDCLSILREQPCKPAHGPELAWSRCPGGSLAADLEYVIRANLRSVTQKATDAIGLSVTELRAALWHHENMCKHISQAKDKSIQIPQDYCIACKTLRFCVGFLVAGDAALNQLQPIVTRY